MKKEDITSVAKSVATQMLETKAKKEAKAKTPVTLDKEDKNIESSFFKALATKDHASLSDITKDVEAEMRSKGQTVGTSADGGYLVPTPTLNSVIEKIHELSSIRPLATVVQMDSPTLKVNTEDSAPTVQYVAEEVAITESKTTFGQATLTAQGIKGLAGFSSEVLMGAVSNPSLRDKVVNDFAREIAKFENAEFISGAGGASAIAGLESYTPDNTSALVAAVTSDDILDLWYSLPVQYRASAVWVMSDTDRALVHKLQDGNSRYLWTDGGGLEQNQPTLLGRPVIVSTDVTADEIHLVDLSYYLIGDYAGLRIDTGTNSDDFAKDRVSVRLVKHTGGIFTNTEAYASITNVDGV